MVNAEYNHDNKYHLDIRSDTSIAKRDISNLRTHKGEQLRGWLKILLSALFPIIFGIFSIVFTIQQNIIAEKGREHEQRQALELKQQTAFNIYIDDVSKRLFAKDYQSDDKKFQSYIRIRTMTTLSQLDTDRKREIILFLYENGLIRTDIPENKRINLRGADLSNIRFNGSSTTTLCNLDYIYLPGVVALNAVFSNCNMKGCDFSDANMAHTQFIETHLYESQLVRTNMNGVTFSYHSSLYKCNLTEATLVQSSFSASAVQRNWFFSTDLFKSDIPSHRLLIEKTDIETNYFHNARFPNGSFPYVIFRYMIQDGNAKNVVCK